MGYRDGRVATQSDLGLPDLCVICRNNKITHHGQLSASAEGMSVDSGNADAVGFADAQDKTMKLLQRLFNLAGRVVGDLDACREGSITDAGDDYNLRFDVLDFRPDIVQLIQ